MRVRLWQNKLIKRKKDYAGFLNFDTTYNPKWEKKTSLNFNNIFY